VTDHYNFFPLSKVYLNLETLYYKFYGFWQKCFLKLKNQWWLNFNCLFFCINFWEFFSSHSLNRFFDALLINIWYGPQQQWQFYILSCCILITGKKYCFKRERDREFECDVYKLYTYCSMQNIKKYCHIEVFKRTFYDTNILTMMPWKIENTTFFHQNFYQQRSRRIWSTTKFPP